MRLAYTGRPAARASVFNGDYAPPRRFNVDFLLWD
jgi:hypothetical protein